MRSLRGFQLGASRGTTLPVVFLFATLGLSLWLGLQAVDAARSHRRTAEGVLADYAGIAVWEHSRLTREHLDYFYRWVFDDVPYRLRRRSPTPDVMGNDLARVTRSARCCSTLRERAWFFRLDLWGGSMRTYPDTVPPDAVRRLADLIPLHRSARRESGFGFLTADAGEVLDSPGVVIYRATIDATDEDRFLYGLVADAEAFGELIGAWYRGASLLPASVAPAQPNDSILRLSVTAPNGVALFESPVAHPRTFSAADTLEPEYGSLITEVSIRPDAASNLIIGGLPRSRLPLLLGLMLLTLGLGAAALRQLQRERQLARLRDDFISGVSHEFRTPLTQIRVFAELLDDGKLSTDEERKRSAGVINREARRLTHLVENILHFSRLNRLPEAPADLEVIDLGEAIEELTDAFAPQANASQARIETDVPSGLRVRAGRGSVHRILANLLDNALKYGAPGQTVRVGATRSGDSVRIHIEDEGPGIPISDRERVWEPYRRLDRDVSGEVQGSGLGLAVVAELCARHGGRTWVESGASGARFVVELPHGDGGLAPQKLASARAWS